MIAVSEKVLAAFRLEHREQLEGIRSYLAAAGGKSDTAARADVDEAFRLAHSLKGGARVCDLREIETLGHHMESLLARVREGVLTLDRTAREAMSLAMDAIEDWMAAPPREQPPAVKARVEAAIGRLCRLPTVAATSAESESAGRPDGPKSDERARVTTTTGTPSADDRPTLRVRAAGLDRVLSLTNDLIAESGRQAALGTELDSLVASTRELSDQWQAVRKLAAPSLQGLTGAPGFARIARYLESCDQQAQRLTAQLRRTRGLHSRSATAMRATCRQLQDQVRDARMVAADSVFDGFRRMVRDLAEEQGKLVEFRALGLDVQADKVVLERLKDPVMHILRNAVVHGIEPPEERAKKGKDRSGHITLQARAVGNRLTLNIADDGRGIDYEKAAVVARQRRWPGSPETAAPGRWELERLLFEPGFSTRAGADRLAGRGIGLSVAFEAVTRLQGTVRFLARPGPGTIVEATVPLTISTHRLLTVGCGTIVVGIPVHAVDRVVRVRSEGLETIDGRPAVAVDQQRVPICAISQLLGMATPALCPMRNPIDIVVLRTPSSRIAAAVDRLLDERDAVIQEFHGPAGRMDRFCGGFILADGGVGLVLNPAKLAASPRPGLRIDARELAEPEQSSRPSTILIVDDSFTTRTLEKAIFEAHGYGVKVAVDGTDALRQLRCERVDLVVSDIQMPRMDGFRLMEEMKADARLAGVPIVLVTSMDRREHRERGLTLGADAYIVKQKFDHEELLRTVQQLIQPGGPWPECRRTTGERRG